MKLLVACVLVFGASAVSAQEFAPGTSPGPDALHRERIEWCDIWITDADKDDRPRVLFIGDSITRGYFEFVEKALEGKTYCARLTSSRSVCDPVFFNELGLILSQYEFDVIHFNNGLHGWLYSEAEYKEGVEDLISALRKYAPQAKLVWAATTPVKHSSSMSNHEARVKDRNAIAAEIMAREKIAINDMFKFVADHMEYIGDDGIHFTREGKEAQGEKAANAVLNALKD
ncbi:MAG: hypothetical protein AMXMBFR84_22050 [Candidatus Hydrogenedentota bacterium]